MAKKKRNRKKAPEKPARSHLQIRVNAEDKQTIRRAADAMGLSISEFVLLYALDAADRLGGLDASGQWPAPHYQLESQSKTASGALDEVPPLFQQRCETAARGGHQGYDNAGWELARHLKDWMPHGTPDEEWRHALLNLDRFIRHRNEPTIIDWFRTYYPACMELVPRRRWAQFARGVLAAARDRQTPRLGPPDDLQVGVPY